MHVTFYRGGARGQTRTAPFTLGLRPGYVYRIQIGGLVDYPEQFFYPSLEVRGSLQGCQGVNPVDFPLTLNFTEDDFRAVARESLVTKAVVLERPDLALPLATRPERPVELRVAAGRDPVAEAATHGRVLLILRMGGRDWDEGELARLGLPGTVLLPGEKGLGVPPVPPWVQWQCLPLLYDPLHGLAPGHEEMCIPDGGDSGLPAGYDREGRLRGLDPSDTVAEYADSLGRRRIAVSNRVCLCVPRFLVLTGEVQLGAQVALLGPGLARTAQGGGLLLSKRVPVEQRKQEFAVEMRTRQQPSAALVRNGPAVFGKIEGFEVTASVRAPGSVNATCLGPEQPPPERPLLLIKWPDKCGALVGDVVTFFLRYTNQGGRPITDVVVSDSLAGRYEFIQGSNRSDRAATFTTQPNEAGSVIVRWQITNPLPPGESGTVSFQVRVR
jgi:uncharacterized repeat protein (TIGR01451 family)